MSKPKLKTFEQLSLCQQIVSGIVFFIVVTFYLAIFFQIEYDLRLKRY